MDHPEAADQGERKRECPEAGEEVDQRVAEALSVLERRHLDVQHEQRDGDCHDAVAEGPDAVEARALSREGAYEERKSAWAAARPLRIAPSISAAKAPPRCSPAKASGPIGRSLSSASSGAGEVE